MPTGYVEKELTFEQDELFPNKVRGFLKRLGILKKKYYTISQNNIDGLIRCFNEKGQFVCLLSL